jgi:hypothetical protein
MPGAVLEPSLVNGGSRAIGLGTTRSSWASRTFMTDRPSGGRAVSQISLGFPG